MHVASAVVAHDGPGPLAVGPAVPLQLDAQAAVEFEPEEDLVLDRIAGLLGCEAAAGASASATVVTAAAAAAAAVGITSWAVRAAAAAVEIL